MARANFNPILDFSSEAEKKEKKIGKGGKKRTNRRGTNPRCFSFSAPRSEFDFSQRIVAGRSAPSRRLIFGIGFPASRG